MESGRDLLRIEGLGISFAVLGGPIHAVRVTGEGVNTFSASKLDGQRQQKFDIAEAAIGLSDLLELADGKACTIEKNKPCDQCSMCRSLGF